MDQTRLFLDCSTLSVSAPPMTMVRPEITIMMTATGAAKNSRPPANICRRVMVMLEGVCSPSSSLPVRSKGSFMGLNSGGIPVA